MGWTPEAKRVAAIQAPRGFSILRPDTRITERPGWYQLLTPSTGSSYLNEVAFSEVDEAKAGAAIDRAVAGYAEHRLPTKWCVGPWTRPEPERFGALLEARGFASWEVRGMACDTDIPLAAADPRIAVVRRPEELDEVIDCAMAGWGIPADQRGLELEANRSAFVCAAEAAPSFAPPVFHLPAPLFAARVDGQVAGTASLYLRDGYGYLVGAQVLEPFRGRGLYRALIGARLAWLRDAGIECAVTQAREATSAPRLERLGLQTAFRSRCYLREASA